MVHVPAAKKLTTPPEIEQTEALDESIVKVTGNPEVAVAVGVYVGPPTTAPEGAVLVKVIVCELWPTENDCCTCGAGFQLASPDWLPSRMHVPTAWNETTPEVMEQIPLDAASTVIVAGSPEVAVALGT